MYCKKCLLKVFVWLLLLADLYSIGGLAPLLGYLKNSHANIRAKAAEVVTTIVQNHPRSQQLVMEANGLEPLLSNFASDLDVTVRTKALGAISCEWSFYLNDFNLRIFWCNDGLKSVSSSCYGVASALIRHNKPGIAAFRLANGYAALRDALSSESVRFQRSSPWQFK